MSNLSRRDFLKGITAGAVTLASSGLISAFADEKIYTPGTYTGVSNGIGTVKVTMTFSETSITACTVDVSEETPVIGGKYGEQLAEAILNAQSAEIDAVSGATQTSTAAMRAAQSCIDQAKGLAPVVSAGSAEADFEIPEGLSVEDVAGSSVELGKISVDEVVDYDIVVVGAGAAGVPAAGSAVLEGAKVALLQKQASVVSQGNCMGAVIRSKSDAQGELNFIHHTNSLCDWRADRDQLRTYIDYSEDAVSWITEMAGLTEGANEEKGISIYMQNDVVYNGKYVSGTTFFDYGDSTLYLSCPFFGPKPKNMGDILQVVVDRMVEENDNFDVFYNTPAVQLVKDGNKVTGVIAKDVNGKYIQYNASKGVILATGDYQNNAAMVNHFCPDAAPFDKKQYQKTGDGIVMAMAAGAKLEPIGHTKMLHDFDSGYMFEEPFLYVNMNGERFTNEDTGYVYLNNILRHEPVFDGPNTDADHPEGARGWFCSVYDNDYMEYAQSPVPAQVMERYIPGNAGENPVGLLDYLTDTHKADTLDELAEMIGVDAETFKATVARYNELCESGFDADFGKNPAFMHPVKNGPFWAIRRHMRLSAICSGIIVNGIGQVLNEDGSIIDNLYAAGNMSGQFYGGADYPYHATGLSLGRCAAIGWAAAKHACGK